MLPPALFLLLSFFVLLQLDLAEFSVAASHQCADAPASRTFLEAVLVTVAADTDATLLVRTELVRLKLRLDLGKEAQQELEAIREKVDASLGLDTRVHSAVYRAAIVFHKARAFRGMVSQRVGVLASTVLPHHGCCECRSRGPRRNTFTARCATSGTRH